VPTYRVLTGPTAAGKTGWLLARARTRPLRVISADSRQVYRGMDIGTGKPTADELAYAPHYGLDLLDPGQPFSAQGFLHMAAAAFAELRDFTGEVWVCGGTGLYIRTLVEGLPLGPPPRPQLRAALWPLIQARGPQAVAAELGLYFAETANPVRVLRRAEHAAQAKGGGRVYAFAGLDPALQATDVETNMLDSTLRAELAQWSCDGFYVLDPGDALEEQIRGRVQAMFAAGLSDEVRALRAAGFGAVDVVAGGIAYAEAGAQLDGAMTEAEAVARASVRTRQYAKRQRTYFKGQGWPILTQQALDKALAAP
jgi:tRNA dimethylallyltransferase